MRIHVNGVVHALGLFFCYVVVFLVCMCVCAFFPNTTCINALLQPHVICAYFMYVFFFDSGIHNVTFICTFIPRLYFPCLCLINAHAIGLRFVFNCIVRAFGFLLFLFWIFIYI